MVGGEPIALPPTTVNFTKRGDSAFAPPVRRGYKAAWIK
jgi:hypothetical protein